MINYSNYLKPKKLI